MPEAGIYLIVKALAGMAGLAVTSPIGGSGIPAKQILDVSASAPPGYSFSIVGSEGKPLGSLHSHHPLRLELDMLPDIFINAVVAAEDKRFIENPGVDPFGTASAVLDVMRGTVRGGSGIAQQMVKNTIVGSDTSYERKAAEAMLATRLVEDLGRPEILRRYLQSAWFGRGITGAALASERWFGKPWSEISAAEAATLAAILKGPARYDPYRFPERVKLRRDAILNTLEDQGWLTPELASIAKDTPVVAIADPSRGTENPWIGSAAAADISEGRIFSSTRGTATVTIDPDWQAISEKALQDYVLKNASVKKPENIGKDGLGIFLNNIAERVASGETLTLDRTLEIELPQGSPYRSTLLLSREDAGWTTLTAWGLETGVTLTDPHKGWSPSVGDVVPATPTTTSDGVKVSEIRLPTQFEGAVVAIDPRSGAILASVGGVDAGLTRFDRTRALRSPGSTIKPFLYLAALNQGMSPEMGIEDLEKTYYTNGVSWHPRNYDNRQMGIMPLYAALERSSNLAAARLAEMIGINAMANIADDAGVYPNGMELNLPSSLGSSSVRPVDLVAGFAAIVNDATPRIVHSISQTQSENGEIHATRFSTGRGAIASPAASFDVLRMLRGVVERGTASVALGKHPVTFAGKTGTSQDHRDAWFVGVTPHIAIGVWLGRDNNKPLPGSMTGGVNAAPIFGTIMSNALDLGLIRSDGYRDDIMSSGMNWPPIAFDGITREEPYSSHNPTYTSHEAIEDSYWGVVDDQRSQPQRSYDQSPADRNGDLLDFQW